MNRSIGISIIAAAMICSSASHPVAGESSSSADSLCLHFSGDSSDLLVQVDRGFVVSGTVPLTLCGFRPGESYSFTVRGKGMEARRGYLALDENGDVSGNYDLHEVKDGEFVLVS